MKFYVRTLGCKMNLLDSSRIATALRRGGHEHVASEHDADIVVVNSCTVTAESDRKSRQAARSAMRDGKRVVLIGCGPRIDPARWKQLLPGVDVAGSEGELCGLLDIDTAAVETPVVSRCRLPVPIQHGCDNVCAYCITRFARGPHRSESLESIVRRVEQAVSQGVHEVVLTGINLAAWGCDTTRNPQSSRLPSLLRALLDRTSIARIRLSSLGPEYLSESFFEVFAEPRICDHLHLSVQSGSPDVLARMCRGHGVEAVRDAARRAREFRPDVAVTADFIVGLPGETERDFGATLQLVRDVRFSQLHVFPYSPRQGTAAARMKPQVSDDEKKQRSSALRALGRELRERFVASQEGKTTTAILEGDGTALTSNYIRLRRAGGQRGELVVVTVRANDVVARR